MEYSAMIMKQCLMQGRSLDLTASRISTVLGLNSGERTGGEKTQDLISHCKVRVYSVPDSRSIPDSILNKDDHYLFIHCIKH